MAMNLETIRTYCLQLPHTTEGIKWEHDLCFMLAEKMYCVTSLTGEFSCSFKCTDEDFVKLTEVPGIIPAPYMARNKWVNVQNAAALSTEDWEFYLQTSWSLIKARLPKKVQQAM
jgi:predicted DNA-binding protein (MmcQ/YjbR family)